MEDDLRELPGVVPPRFEDEFPEEAAFMARVFASGGSFRRTLRYRDEDVPPPVGVPRNHPCPCGSGKKTKRCHVNWTS